MQQKLKTRAAKLSIASNLTLIVLKLGVGLAMHSVSVISEAVHSAIDLVAALIAIRLTGLQLLDPLFAIGIGAVDHQDRLGAGRRRHPPYSRRAPPGRGRARPEPRHHQGD